MGECPRYFKLDIIYNNEVHHLQNLKPDEKIYFKNRTNDLQLFHNN